MCAIDMLCVRSVLMSDCLGFLSGMLSAAIVEDCAGIAKYGNPSLGKAIVTIFEGHALLGYFVKVCAFPVAGHSQALLFAGG